MPSAASRQRKKEEREAAESRFDDELEADKAKRAVNTVSSAVLVATSAFLLTIAVQAFLQPKTIRKSFPNLLRGSVAEPEEDVLADDEDKDKFVLSENWSLMMDGHASSLFFALTVMSFGALWWTGMKRSSMSINGLLLLLCAGATTLDSKTFQKPPMSFFYTAALGVAGIANLAGAASYSEPTTGKKVPPFDHREVPLAGKLLFVDACALAGVEYARWVLGSSVPTGSMCQLASAGRLMLGVHFLTVAFSSDTNAIRTSLLAVTVVTSQAMIAALIFYTWSLAGIACGIWTVVGLLHIRTLRQPPLVNPFAKQWRQTRKALFSSGIEGYGDD
jgi:hypothetical protein